MANEQHLKVIKQGVQAWNTWRLLDPALRPNLIDADLEAQTFREYTCMSQISLGSI
ncbi:MAG TPA: hypothetical protein VHA33_18595 [Candidatus Angelobacter sp.]|nr:hypothetical protein [Candidatus Angelobacter sp.]